MQKIQMQRTLKLIFKFEFGKQQFTKIKGTFHSLNGSILYLFIYSLIITAANIFKTKRIVKGVVDVEAAAELD